jgi:hypothetical protein
MQGKMLTAKKTPAARLVAMTDVERANERGQVQTLVKRQDETLTDISAGLDRLREGAEVIGTELRSQGKMLDELNEDVEEAKSGVDRMTRGIGKLLKTKDNCQIMTVIVLTLVLAGMVALVILL